ncbi:hypothetical protein DFP94_1011328 [Fontibacillus phaseoli]|uniref:Uncharacterized protein n=1 Tax=Fontibacillus phaseoli TaxID=1416533 RepID=A0A369BT17_9BACL|nr:hypothetical protein DFP94_1011328 [Fontibacillus phaseoli]
MKDYEIVNSTTDWFDLERIVEPQPVIGDMSESLIVTGMRSDSNA